MLTPNHRPHTLRRNLEAVVELGLQTQHRGLYSAVQAVKSFQRERFFRTYSDLLREANTRPASLFFLNELYGQQNTLQRDQQFTRIASGIERVFPGKVANLALELSEFYLLSEQLDTQMGEYWAQSPAPSTTEEAAQLYRQCWIKTGRHSERIEQVKAVQKMGHTLIGLTAKKKLGLAIKLMRKPANLAGLTALHHTVETGFVAFCALSNPENFIETISEREQEGITLLFGESSDLGEQWLLSPAP